jgi:hypothetical protein
MGKDVGKDGTDPVRALAAGEPACGDDDNAWVRFVLTHGRGSRNRDLAAVLGRSVQDVEGAKKSGPASGRASLGEGKDKGVSGYGFAQLFLLWHGREPAEPDWPKPQFQDGKGSYEWLLPEVTLLATLVGTMGPREIADVLTTRLRKVTGDAAALRDRQAVQNQIGRLGLQAGDVIGGVTAAAAGRQIGSGQVVYQAIKRGDLPTRRVGRHVVIPHKAWDEFKAKMQFAPEGFVQLSTLKGPLGVASDKLSEFCRMGHVPEAVRVNTFGAHSMHTTQFGTWYVPQAIADKLVEDRRAGRPMPWHGKPLMDNLKKTWALYDQRRHPAACETCQGIWGPAGAPRDFDDYMRRYPSLAHGAKRHLTMVYSPGITVAEVAEQAKRSVAHVRRALASGTLQGRKEGRETYVTRTNATRWIARSCPDGEGERSWIRAEAAQRQYLLTPEEIRQLVGAGQITSKVGMSGAAKGVLFLMRQQCVALWEKNGFSEEQAAARAKVSVEHLRELLKGVDWRGTAAGAAGGGRIPLVTVQAVIKRIESKHGYTIEEAAAQLGADAAWVQARVDDGTISIKRTKWDERLYVTRPMLERLRLALDQGPRVARPAAEWVRLSRAAGIAGVSTTTIIRWGQDGVLRHQPAATGMHYLEGDVRAQAREYWKTARFTRASRRPAWLAAEIAAELTAESSG